MKAQAYVLCGNMKDGDDEHQIKLISMNTPITTLKNHFLHDKSKFWEIPDRVPNLRTSMNVIIYDIEIAEQINTIVKTHFDV